MSLLREDGREAAVTTVVVACLAFVVLVPAVTVAAHGSVSGDSTAAVPETAVNDRDSVSCGQWAGSDSGKRAQASPESSQHQSMAANGEEERVPLGGIAFVSVPVAEGAESTVEIGREANHTVRATVSDDGDGRATLRINTYAAANTTAVDSRAYDVTGADEMEIRTNETDAPMTNRTYSVEVTRDGAVVDERQLNVTAPDLGTAAAFAGPPQLAEVGSLDALRRAEDLGMVSTVEDEYNRTMVRYGETLGVRIESASVLGAVAAQPGETMAEKLGRVYAGHDRDPPVTVALSGPCYSVELGDAVAEGAVEALPDYENGTLTVLIDTGRIAPYSMTVAMDIDVDPSGPLGDVEESRWYEQTEFADPDERPTVERAGPYSYVQRVDGIVSWPTNGTVEIRGESDRDSVPITVRSLTDPTNVARTSAAVDEESFRAVLVRSAISNPGLYEVAVGNTTYTATLGDPPNVTWEIGSPPAAAGVDRLPIERLTLEDGGFLVAYAPDENGSTFRPVGVADTDDIAIPVGALDGARHLVVVAHRDADGDGRFDGPETDPAYRVGGNVVRKWATVEADDASPTADPSFGSFNLSKVGEPVSDGPTQTTVEPTPTATQTPTSTSTPTPTATQTLTTPGTPTPAATPTATTEAPTPTASPTPTATGHFGSTTATGTGAEGTSADGPGFGSAALVVALAVFGLFGTYRRIAQ
ncbi:DUF7827 domain-containing protein [Halosimplex sp. J119]